MIDPKYLKVLQCAQQLAAMKSLYWSDVTVTFSADGSGKVHLYFVRNTNTWHSSDLGPSFLFNFRDADEALRRFQDYGVFLQEE